MQLAVSLTKSFSEINGGNVYIEFSTETTSGGLLVGVWGLVLLTTMVEVGRRAETFCCDLKMAREREDIIL